MATELAALTAGRYLLAAGPSFDAGFLGAFLRRHGRAPAWDHRLVDVLALAAGRFGMAPPWIGDHLSHKLGVPLEPTNLRHTALSDARWSARMFEAVTARG